MTTTSRDNRRTREDARVILEQKIASQQITLASRSFSTIDPNYLIADAEWRLRWIDCAPEGARHCIAPLQDKNGAPLGDCWNENVGPAASLRAARVRRDLDPFSGRRVASEVQA